MMSDEDKTVLVADEAGVRTVTLNRPNVLNAFNKPLAVSLAAVLSEAETDAGVRCVVITGAGRAFCSGQDLAELAEGYNTDEPLDLSERLRVYYNPVTARIRAMEKPVLAAVNGVAAGAGCSLALACDLRIASESASFIEAFINVGLIPDAGSTFILPRLIGLSRAMDLAFTGRKVGAKEALELGLVNRVAPEGEFQDSVKSFAKELADKPTRAIGIAKRALNSAWTVDLETQLYNEAQLQAVAQTTRDHREGLAAFLEKRKPNFTGE
jgi:2-(1,2-epoxy-1,2-dihydrophenyl)acetyl-CoA isomerase